VRLVPVQEPRGPRGIHQQPAVLEEPRHGVVEGAGRYGEADAVLGRQGVLGEGHRGKAAPRGMATRRRGRRRSSTSGFGRAQSV